MKTKYNLILLVLFCFTISVSAQQQLTKMSKKIDVTKDVTIDLNTSFVEIEIDTWNKSTLEIEAYIDGEKLSKEDLEKALKNWKLKVEGSGSRVSITSEGGGHGTWDQLTGFDKNFEPLMIIEGLDLGDIPELPEMPEMPELPEIARFEMPEMPELPELPELPEGVNNVSFDTEAYKKGGEAYLEKWSKEYEEKYGAEYKQKMKEWARKMGEMDFSAYERKMEAWGDRFGEEYGKKMEAWGEEFGKQFDKDWAKKMEVWGEKYGKQMEERAKVMEERLAEREKQMEKRTKEMEKRQEKLAKRLEERHEVQEQRREEIAKRIEERHLNVKKVIKIKMPKDAKLNLNVRHGQLKMASVIHNLKADISHATFLANHIDGSETSINVSFSPVHVTTWSAGELNLKYVEDAHLNTVRTLRLNSNSSDIRINDLIENAIIDGSFGDLSISNIADSFTNLNIILENSEALIKLPSKTTDYSVYFKGNRSRLNDQLTTQKTITNFPNSKNSAKTIIINAKFSAIVLN
ncbi:hypothetical protein [Psychroserpens sp. SPM9]|uniref:hypothetical protein n=1 Tax=Psychroserpens sp. SPM9 TaxID=2975598 RepID=UPI0021A954C3|nr:hypothetical protein [Psychroserpens sp. SPM9]MDG5492277.1 hypothetical protein [Psychroserpens sp. SPM9]